MCANAEKARFLKILVEEIRAAAAKRRARKATEVAPAPEAWTHKGAEPAAAAD